MKTTQILAVIAAIGLAAFIAKDPQEINAQVSDEESQALLDGKTFLIECYASNDEGMSDTLSFADGTCHSTACDAWGFSKASYVVTTEGDEIIFTATTISSTEGSMKWRGTFDGEQITGDVVWTKEGQESVSYEFRGPLQ